MPLCQAARWLKCRRRLASPFGRRRTSIRSYRPLSGHRSSGHELQPDVSQSSVESWPLTCMRTVSSRLRRRKSAKLLIQLSSAENLKTGDCLSRPRVRISPLPPDTDHSPHPRAVPMVQAFDSAPAGVRSRSVPQQLRLKFKARAPTHAGPAGSSLGPFSCLAGIHVLALRAAWCRPLCSTSALIASADMGRPSR